MKLCKDCKHCVPDKAWLFSRNKWEYATCAKTLEIIPAKVHEVDGYIVKAQKSMNFCDLERKSVIGRCGQEAAWFEDKE
jgi:hypothetical protein